jgi:NAD(P)-dependent dehydrogenase (short-subunit alcohol dehydrogenase family)
MTNEFKNEWALILGGSSGLGLASAKKLAAHGMNICIVHRDRKTDLEVFSSEVGAMKDLGVKVVTFNLDALKTETIAEVISALPERSVKIIIHSIAKGTVKPMLGTEGNQLTTEDLALTINAMALSWFEWTQALITAQKISPNTRNVGFTSEGNTKAITYYGAVSAAKATMEALMRQMAVEYAPLRMTTNCIQAGVTQTRSFRMIPGSEQIAKHAQKRNPFQRLTTVEDVANAVYLLCREEARWINGTVLKVDGGESLR